MAKLTGAERCIFEMELFVSNVVTLIAVAVTNDIVTSTPVDTSFAKKSWIPSIGKPSGAVGGSKGSPNAGAQQTGKAILSKYNLRLGRIYIVNNVPYIGDLNNGSSAQAPSGFVQGGIVRGVTKAKGLALALSASRSR